MRKGVVVANARRTIVDEEIKQQLDCLTTAITVRLGNEQRTLVGRLDHEANNIEVSIREVSLSTFVQKASRKEVETDHVNWFREAFCGERAKVKATQAS